MSTTRTPWFVLNSPEIGRPFADLLESCGEAGVLDEKTKELLMVAVACVFRSRHNLEERIKSAMAAGATREEVTEVLLIAVIENARTQLAGLENLCWKYLT